MDLLGGFLNNLELGLNEAVSLRNLMYCFFGVFLGTAVGVLPGLGAFITIALLLPFTYHLDSTAALVMLAGVYFGASYGGSTTAILLKVPGTPSSAVVCLDGYPMAQQGRAGVALFITTVASFVGSAVGIIILMAAGPFIAEFALKFGPAEYCAMMLLGLMASATVGQGSPIKGVAMVVLGLLLGIVGTDVNSGVARFSFGIPELTDGIALVALAMGLFAVAEVINSINKVSTEYARKRITMRSLLPKRDDWRRTWAPLLRGSSIGSFFGALPGTGGSIASFMAYAVEKRVAREPERFGKGAIEGVVAPESANNAACGTAFIPTLTLGIPGDAVMAIMIGAMMIHGIQPGPQLMTAQPELFWGLIMSFWIGNIMLVILNIPLIGIWVRMLTVPYSVLYPAILLFVCVGVYSVSNNVFDVWVALVFGVLGYFMILLRFEVVPLILGLILGPLLEENLRRALLLSRGDFGVFLQRPISATILAVTTALLVWSVWSFFRHGRKGLGQTLLEKDTEVSPAPALRRG